MKILFPRNAMMHKLPEPVFEAEFEAANSLEYECILFAEDLIDSDGINRAIADFPAGDGGQLLYRGWIMKEELYRTFHDTLASRGFKLISTPDEYARVTYFPNYYPFIRDHSPPAVWTETPDTFAAWSSSRKLGDGPFVIKDHIKSAKHMWHEACFVPKGAGREQLEWVAKNLLEEQGKVFNRGFVVKEYIPLRSRGPTPREYPMCEEYRLFFWKGELLIAAHYHNLSANPVDFSAFICLAKRVKAPFFTMDIALTEAGRWIVVDMGAGECSSLPPSLPAIEFYRQLKARLGMTTSAN